jgi:hypothetical protein
VNAQTPTRVRCLTKRCTGVWPPNCFARQNGVVVARKATTGAGSVSRCLGADSSLSSRFTAFTWRRFVKSSVVYLPKYWPLERLKRVAEFPPGLFLVVFAKMLAL